MSSIALQDNSSPFNQGTFFENHGTQYTLHVIPEEGAFRVIVRERATNLFVKEIGPLDEDGLKRLASKIAKFQNVVYLYDIFDMTVLDAIERHVAYHGETPTYATLALTTKATYGEIGLAMKRLEEKGFIERSFHNKKGFKILRYRRDA